MKNYGRPSENQKALEESLKVELQNNEFKIQLYERKRRIDEEMVSEDDQSENEENYNQDPDYMAPPEKIQKTFVEKLLRRAQQSPLVTSTLDRTQTTNNQMTLIMGSLVQAANLNIDKTVISASTLRTKREFFLITTYVSHRLLCMSYVNKSSFWTFLFTTSNRFKCGQKAND